jgi:serine phosphatase RsbU (regulator of sigma subunit)
MSGGHFNYMQYNINYISDEIQHLIDNNNIKDEWDYCRNYSPETLEKFKEAVRFCEIASVYVQRIDWLVSGDDGEETFHKRLKEDLEELET